MCQILLYYLIHWFDSMNLIKLIWLCISGYNIKNIGLAKEKIEYPELKRDDKKATSDKEKVELFNPIKPGRGRGVIFARGKFKF